MDDRLKEEIIRVYEKKGWSVRMVAGHYNLGRDMVRGVLINAGVMRERVAGIRTVFVAGHAKNPSKFSSEPKSKEDIEKQILRMDEAIAKMKPGETLSEFEIAKIMDISHQRVNQIIKKAMKNLRKDMTVWQLAVDCDVIPESKVPRKREASSARA